MPNDSNVMTERGALLAGIRRMLPALQSEAAAQDGLAEFPAQSFDQLRRAGLLRASVPEAYGGMGFGEGEDGAKALMELLQILGQASLALARLYEAHVNALQLVCRYGGARLIEACARDAIAGELFALWVTDPSQGGLVLHKNGDGFVLAGAKAFCSGAGKATRALVTASSPAGIRMLMIKLAPGTRVMPSHIKLAGMRAAVTGAMDLTGIAVAADELIGGAGDYLREPVFSAGAWRGSAAALGALTALVEIHRGELLARGRADDAHQAARFGRLVIAHETARLWTGQAALRGCLEDDSPAAIIAYVNFARLAVESACLEGMQLTQRGLGLGAFIAGHPAERICRDLAVYLRQPAPDETLTKAAGFYFHAPLPRGQG